MNVILLGPPGAGKGTVSERIKDEFSFIHFSTGNVLRDEISKGTALGNEAKSYIDKGSLVPDHIMVAMVQNILGRTTGQGILFDGFPRTITQAEELAKLLDIHAVIYMDVALESIVNRICTRRVCKDCGAVYSAATAQQDVCAKCGGELIVRPDDNRETVERRYHVYLKDTQPLIDYYKNRNMLYTVTSSDAPPEVVARETACLIKKAAGI